MKQFKLLTILPFVLIMTSCNGQDKKATMETDQSISKIEVFDFHSTHRCMTCNAIEASTKYTLDTYFSNELKDGTITFQVVNVDKPENEKIAKKFEASGTALFLNIINNGKETQIDLTEFAFMKGNEQDEFAEELKIKLDTELKKL